MTGESSLLLEIIGQLKLQNIPALAVHSLTASDTTYVIYRLMAVGKQNGYPVLKIIGSIKPAAESTTIESGLLIYDSSSGYDVKEYDTPLVTALNAITFG